MPTVFYVCNLIIITNLLHVLPLDSAVSTSSGRSSLASDSPNILLYLSLSQSSCVCRLLHSASSLLTAAVSVATLPSSFPWLSVSDGGTVQISFSLPSTDRYIYSLRQAYIGAPPLIYTHSSNRRHVCKSIQIKGNSINVCYIT